MQAVVFRLDDASAAAQQVEDQHYYRNHKQQVNQRATDTAEHPQQPQNQQNNYNCPKHSAPPGVSTSFVSSAPRLYPDSGFTFQMLRPFEISFRAVLDIRENNWPR